MKSEETTLKVSVGAIPYLWPPERVHAFYRSLPEGIVDTVYVGESICSKRRAIRAVEWLAIARELAGRFSDVILTTLTLIEAESELSALKRACENGEFLVEANDFAAVMLLAERGLPFVASPFLNVYNARSLHLLAQQGAIRWVPPVEMSQQQLCSLIADYRELGGPSIETEIFAYGRVPLAHSARCFTARVHGRNKDNCNFVCGDHAYGLPIATREQQSFLHLNGIQVQSAAIHAITDLASLRNAGVNHVRLVPANDLFTDVLVSYAESHADNIRLPHSTVDGYWRGTAGMSSRSAS